MNAIVTVKTAAFVVIYQYITVFSPSISSYTARHSISEGRGDFIHFLFQSIKFLKLYHVKINCAPIFFLSLLKNHQEPCKTANNIELQTNEDSF